MSKKNHLFYFTNYFPASKARHVQIAKMVDSFMDTTLDVKFILRELRQTDNSDYRSNYNLKNVFDIVEIPSLRILPLKYDYYYKYNLRNYLGKLRSIYDPNNIFLYSRYGKNTGPLTEILVESGVGRFRGVFAEVHEGLSGCEEQYVKKLDGVIVLNNSLKKHLIEKGVDERRILVAPSSADSSLYIRYSSACREDLRELLDLPKYKSLVVYTGHLYDDRGVEDLISAAKYLDDDIQILLVGGLERDLKRLKNMLSGSGFEHRIRFEGMKRPSSIPLYQMSADVLVMPYSGNWELREWSSPLKMFEYMFSKRPIVATDFPVVRDILNESNSLLVKPGDQKGIAKGISKCINDREFADSIAIRAFEDVCDFTWSNRAKRIIEFMERVT